MIRLRPELERLGGYASGRTGSADDARFARAALLASNELPYPPLPSVLEAIASAGAGLHRYPDPDATILREAIGALHGVGAEQVATGAGSVELCRQAILAVAGPGDDVVMADPTFPEYAAITTLAGASPRSVALRDDAYDLAAIGRTIGSRTRAVVICNPNNPTGTALAVADIVDFLAVVPRDVLVVVDEAYAEFADPAYVAGGVLMARYDNVLVLRTFSKAYGLAGLRVGYALGSAELVDALARVRLPFGVGTLAQVAATAAVAAVGELAERVREVVAERDRVTAALVALGWRVPSPQGNFVYLDALGETARLASRLGAADVLVRTTGAALRVTIGTPSDNDRFLDVLAREHI